MYRLLSAVALAVVLAAAGTAMAAERTVTLTVKNMYCSACPYIVGKSLKKVSGVEKVAVSFEKKTATVTYDDAKTNVAALIQATTRAGYPSQPIADPVAAR